MFEHYLALASHLRGRGMTEALGFVSSNTEDFDLKEPSLTAELGARDVKLLPNLSNARGYLGLP